MPPKLPADVVSQVANILAAAIQQTREEQHAYVKATWDTLNRNEKGVFALSLTESGTLTQQQIADVVKTSQPTISNYVRKARERKDRELP